MLDFSAAAAEGVAVGTTGTTMAVVVLKLLGQFVTVGWQLVMTTFLVLKTVCSAGDGAAAAAEVWT